MQLLLLFKQLIMTLWPFYKDLVYVPEKKNENAITTLTLTFFLILGCYAGWDFHTKNDVALPAHKEVDVGPESPPAPEDDPPCEPPHLCDLYRRVYKYQEDE